MGRSRRRSSAAEHDDNAAGALRSDTDRIIDAAFALIPVEGWRRLSLARIAAEAGLPLVRIYRQFRSKEAILCGFFSRVDEALLAEPPLAEEGERPRDRLFDLVMRRFDALRPYKPALEVLRRELLQDPTAMLSAGLSLQRSMRWMHEAAEIATSGVRGNIGLQLTIAAYLATLRVWYGDNSPDLAQTMATLDARLRRVENWLVPVRPLSGIQGAPLA